ncbi:MAG: hypothetical protein U5K84_06290 [Alkalibacterium sp.]|nr:hypothetical protein [Alkalibacterium sp.]
MNEKDRLTIDAKTLSALVRGTGKFIERFEQKLSKSDLRMKIPAGSLEPDIKEDVSAAKILIANDDAAELTFLEELLKNQGYEVVYNKQRRSCH